MSNDCFDRLQAAREELADIRAKLGSAERRAGECHADASHYASHCALLVAENESLRQQLAASDAALIESRANDREAMRQLAEAQARTAEIESELSQCQQDRRREHDLRVRLAGENEELERVQGVLVESAQGLLMDVQDLINESEGVAGFHLNGDVAPWGELLSGGRFERLGNMDAVRAALAEAKKG